MASQEKAMVPVRVEIVRGKCPPANEIHDASLYRHRDFFVHIEVTGGRFEPGHIERLKCRVIGIEPLKWGGTNWRVVLDLGHSLNKDHGFTTLLHRFLIGYLDTYLRTGYLQEDFSHQSKVEEN